MLTRATARLNREGGAAAPTTSMANGLGQPLNSVQEGVRGGGTLGRTRVTVPGHQGEERHNGSESSERRGSVENGSAFSALAVEGHTTGVGNSDSLADGYESEKGRVLSIRVSVTRPDEFKKWWTGEKPLKDAMDIAKPDPSRGAHLSKKRRRNIPYLRVF